VAVPVFVIIGKKDIQVDWRADGEPLQRAAAGRKDITFLFPENVNHVLKTEVRPRSDLVMTNVLPDYNSPDACLDPQTMARIQEWLTAYA